MKGSSFSLFISPLSHANSIEEIFFKSPYKLFLSSAGHVQVVQQFTPFKCSSLLETTGGGLILVV